MRPAWAEAPPNRNDVWMGAGLVLLYAIAVTVTALTLRESRHAVENDVLLCSLAISASLAMVLLPWNRLSNRLLVGFPLIALGAELAVAASSEKLPAELTGFFVLSFIYIGLTQPRGTATRFAVIVTPVWIYSQHEQLIHSVVRLPIALSVWILAGELLATRTGSTKTHADQLAVQANTDPLTGLASRLPMMDCLNHYVESGQRMPSALLLLDLDGFKEINDAFGHATGDQLLIVISERIRGLVRSSDLVARLGGDEFAIYLNNCPLATALSVGEALRRSILEPIALERGSVNVSASIGLVSLDDYSSAEEALRDVDVAMYEAKGAGKGSLAVFETDMQERCARRLEREIELRTAFEKDQFEVHYQPTVNTETHEIVGFEALIRWNHPVEGWLPASAFIYACEDTGLIVPLGTWILRQACGQIREWQPIDPARRLTMSVNLSPRQILDDGIVKCVSDALTEADLPGSSLVLEITERILLVDSPVVLERLDALKALGVRIALDDFGTGYSSLAYLREFPIDILKIDRSFVTPLDEDPKAVALARAIIAIAEALDLDVIAEGAETAGQVHALSRCGCFMIQGHYFARPDSAANITARQTSTGRFERIDLQAGDSYRRVTPSR
jgi:diguanylate cyclase (GGDEF)-like protein